MSEVFEVVAAGQQILTPQETGLVAAIGAGARDLHLRQGIQWPNYQPGAKTKFKSDDYTRLSKLREGDYRTHLGGNMFNAATALAAWGHLLLFCGVRSSLSDPDPTSNLIYEHLQSYGIDDRMRERHGYQLSSSVIMYGEDDREVRGIGRDSMDEALSVEYLRDAMRDASTIVFASLKEWVLNRRVLSLTAELPPDVFVSANFGSSEFKDHPKQLLAAMDIRKPDLLAINETEIGQLYSSTASPRELTANASKKDARFVLTTCGKDGVLLGHNGDVEHAPAIRLRSGMPIYTLGAGDRAHALALSGLTRGMPPEKIPELVALGTLPVLQTIGAHGDLKPLHR